MVNRPSLLCPVDFSTASRGALRYAAAIAEHFYAALTVVAVNDRFLTQAAEARFGDRWLERRTAQELDAFITQAFPKRTPQMPTLEKRVLTGSAAAEILDVAASTQADAIVMSTHGASGVRKLMFGSTTERVLRETTIPVIVTPPHDPGPESLEDWRDNLRVLLVPVDLSPYSKHQVRIANGLAEALGARVVLAHVQEPIRSRSLADDVVQEISALRSEMVTRRLEELCALAPASLQPVTTIVASGDPAEEIARLARECSAGAVVMGLHSSAIKDGPRMGTVTYRLLCATPVVVVACPPRRITRIIRPADYVDDHPQMTQIKQVS
jgi:nucleotide-binding universal stress UspA family protein